MGKLEKIEKCVQKGKEDELVKLVHDRDKNVRLAAIAGLGRAGKDNACNVLITLLLDDDPECKYSCRMRNPEREGLKDLKRLEMA